ncbi:MAG TPA: hypothetical protein VEZ55_05955, partial [Chitinophagaceae bacterium]|nr:hypothetical protein [Chitinophagaceae bacterium]
VLIFSEGLCKNEWHLRPLRKGTARLAISSWEQGIDVTVVPMAFNYSSFRCFGKTVHINIGDPLPKADVLQHGSEGKRLVYFNELLQLQLSELVYEIEPSDKTKLKRLFNVKQSSASRILLALPAAAGWLLHAPLFYSIKLFANKKFNNEHYDAVMLALHFLLYPFYLLIVIAAGLKFFGGAALAGILLMPFTAWACVQLKKPLDD